jgi:hypothetical protein
MPMGHSGVSISKILHADFLEFTFYAVSILENGCGRHLGPA